MSSYKTRPWLHLLEKKKREKKKTIHIAKDTKKVLEQGCKWQRKRIYNPSGFAVIHILLKCAVLANPTKNAYVPMYCLDSL